MDVLIFFAFVAAVSGAWWRFTEQAKSIGKGWFMRNWISGTMATFIGLVALGFMTSGGWWSIVGAVIVFYAASAPWMRIEGNDVRWERSLWRPGENDKAKPAKPMWNERHSPAMSFDDEETDPPPIVSGRNIDVIRFDYLNKKDEYSSRRIKVTMVGAWHFEGVDLDKHAERTFRYERVVGDITSEKTGEVLDPEAWAASINPAVLSP